jgi:hypothetical protein
VLKLDLCRLEIESPASLPHNAHILLDSLGLEHLVVALLNLESRLGERIFLKQLLDQFGHGE